jgi:hypothetical protein
MIIKNGFLVFSKVFSPNQQAPSPGGQRGTPIPAYGLGCSVYTPIADPHHDDWSAITNRVGFFIRNSVIELPPSLYVRSIVIPCVVQSLRPNLDSLSSSMFNNLSAFESLDVTTQEVCKK